MNHRVDIDGETRERGCEPGPQGVKGEHGTDALALREEHALATEPLVPEVVDKFDISDPRANTTLFFSRYQEDGSLRLYPERSYIGDAPAAYSAERVSVKIMVKRPSEEFLVVIPISRRELDLPGAEERLAEIAYNWRHR